MAPALPDKPARLMDEDADLLADLAGTDLLQAMKNFDEPPNDANEGIFPLQGFELAEAPEPESEESRIRQMQARMERRCQFLLRRLRILQARAIGKRVSDEVGQSFERCLKGARRDGSGRPVSLKAFLKRVETTGALQSNSAGRTVAGPKYFHTGHSSGDATRAASVGVPTGTLTGLEDTAGALRSHLSMVKYELDVDATASSSGAESNDEDVAYNNPHQRHMAIEQRALWTWQRARASIASRWVWVQLRLQELEYKIRQYIDLQKQVRAAKGPVEFDGVPEGYEGPLPGSEGQVSTPEISTPDVETEYPDTCARIRPLRRETFKKRRLLQMNSLHMATDKVIKAADIQCDCAPDNTCPVCVGRSTPHLPGPPAPPACRRLTRLDPSLHPVLSDIRDVSPALHVAALTSRAWFRSRSATGPARRAALPTPAGNNNTPKLKRGRPPGRKNKDASDPDFTERSLCRGSRPPRPAFDIDNIVIPHSMAAATRPEILHYKDILTPKWRVLEIPLKPLNNGFVKNKKGYPKHFEEDVSELAVRARHARAAAAERARYLPPAAPPSALHRPLPYAPRHFPLHVEDPGELDHTDNDPDQDWEPQPEKGRRKRYSII